MIRLSRLFVPVAKHAAQSLHGGHIDPVTQQLIAQGYIRPSSSGVYNFLPLGLMVQDKIAAVVRKHLASLDASELALTSLGNPELWHKTGRLDNGELFTLPKHDDAKSPRYVLNPTHEEEVTTIVAETISSYKQLPLRLFQIGRKFRDEKRPRGGLLRCREFVMKDMYSFDRSPQEAHETYAQVQAAYRRIFTDLGMADHVCMADADAGSIGGNLSHEFHLLSPAGEDKIVQCGSCGYSANVERALSYSDTKAEHQDVAYFDTHDGQLVAVYFPRGREVNPSLVKLHVGPVTPATAFDGPVSTSITDIRLHNHESSPVHAPVVMADPQSDTCPVCHEPDLRIVQGIEVGHTFYLGTKYSLPLQARFSTADNEVVPIEMGCYGIGVSRLVAAISQVNSEGSTLRWPRAVAPFEALIVTDSEKAATDIGSVLTGAGISFAWDDRLHKFGARLAMSRRLGVPFVIVAGQRYEESGKVEVQRESSVIEVALEDLCNL